MAAATAAAEESERAVMMNESPPEKAPTDGCALSEVSSDFSEIQFKEMKATMQREAEDEKVKIPAAEAFDRYVRYNLAKGARKQEEILKDADHLGSMKHDLKDDKHAFRHFAGKCVDPEGRREKSKVTARIASLLKLNDLLQVPHYRSLLPKTGWKSGLYEMGTVSLETLKKAVVAAVDAAARKQGWLEPKTRRDFDRMANGLPPFRSNGSRTALAHPVESQSKSGDRKSSSPSSDRPEEAEVGIKTESEDSTKEGKSEYEAATDKVKTEEKGTDALLCKKDGWKWEVKACKPMSLSRTWSHTATRWLVASLWKEKVEVGSLFQLEWKKSSVRFTPLTKAGSVTGVVTPLTKAGSVTGVEGAAAPLLTFGLWYDQDDELWSNFLQVFDTIRTRVLLRRSRRLVDSKTCCAGMCSLFASKEMTADCGTHDPTVATAVDDDCETCDLFRQRLQDPEEDVGGPHVAWEASYPTTYQIDLHRGAVVISEKKTGLAVRAFVPVDVRVGVEVGPGDGDDTSRSSYLEFVVGVHGALYRFGSLYVHDKLVHFQKQYLRSVSPRQKKSEEAKHEQDQKDGEDEDEYKNSTRDRYMAQLVCLRTVRDVQLVFVHESGDWNKSHPSTPPWWVRASSLASLLGIDRTNAVSRVTSHAIASKVKDAARYFKIDPSQKGVPGYSGQMASYVRWNSQVLSHVFGTRRNADASRRESILAAQDMLDTLVAAAHGTSDLLLPAGNGEWAVSSSKAEGQAHQGKRKAEDPVAAVSSSSVKKSRRGVIESS